MRKVVHPLYKENLKLFTDAFKIRIKLQFYIKNVKFNQTKIEKNIKKNLSANTCLFLEF